MQRRVLLVLAVGGLSFAGTARVQAQTPHQARSELGGVPKVSFGSWLEQLLEVLDNTAAPTVEAEFLEFARRRRLDESDRQLRTDFRRMRLLFEAARDGGFWHLRWAITNEKPTSRNIWSQLCESPTATEFSSVSATAECDELSAFVGMLAKHAGITNVGLFYPTWNHTIAVWAPLAGKTRSELVQLPTSQIFLSCDAGFDRTTFRTKRTNIQAYPAFDLRPYALIPRDRAEWLLAQLKRYAEGSGELWSLVRAHRAYLMGSSVGECNEWRNDLAADLARNLSPADQRILVEVGKHEFAMRSTDAKQVLAQLATHYAPAAQ